MRRSVLIIGGALWWIGILIFGGLAALFMLVELILSLLFLGVPAYLLLVYWVPGRRKILAASAAMGLSIAGAWNSPKIVHECVFSYEAESYIASKLTQDEAKTLSRISTVDKPSRVCTHYFQFNRNGKLVTVGAYDDFIHGIKLRYEGDEN